MVKHDGVRDDFAQLLRSQRRAQGWSVAKLARMLGVTEATVANWEHGHSAPNFDGFLFLCVLFGWPHPLLPAQSVTAPMVV